MSLKWDMEHGCNVSHVGCGARMKCLSCGTWSMDVMSLKWDMEHGCNVSQVGHGAWM